MPELPEVETTVRGLAPVLEGRRIASIELRRQDLRRPFPPDLRQRLTGARVIGLGRRAKYGLIETDRGDTFVFHLGMSGSWRIDPAEIGLHDHVTIETDEGTVVLLTDAVYATKGRASVSMEFSTPSEPWDIVEAVRLTQLVLQRIPSDL